jgi:hypothetical protein
VVMGPGVRRDDVRKVWWRPSAVIPAKAGIQYSRAAEIESRGRGVLGRPVKPGDDSGV